MEKLDFNSIYDDSIGEAILEIRTSLVNSCNCKENNNSFDILQCLYCDNCYYKIIIDNNDGITTYSELDKIPKNSFDDDYLILFYDKIPTADEIYSYLFNDDSKYRIIRFSDSEIMVDNHYKKQQKVYK